VVVALTPRQSTEGMCSGITGEHRSREVPKLFLVEASAL
jgi:hypothetical protein